MSTSRRKERVTELIRKEVAEIVSRKIGISDAIVTFTRVDVSIDIQNANIYFLTIPDSAAEEVHKKLNKNIFSIQQALNKRLRMRPIPRIRFSIDKQEQEASKIDELLTRI
jgi:ribosome-binding factor A